MQNSNKLPWKTRLGYGLGDYSLNIFWQGTALFLFYFLTEISGFSPYDAGLLISLSILWDLITDPLTGYFAERLKTDNPYLKIIKYTALPLCLSFTLLFSAPQLLDPEYSSFITCLLVLLLFRTLYTLISIPYSSLTIQLTSDTRERNKLAGIRMYFGFLGGMSVIVILTAAQDLGVNAKSFSSAVGICSAIAFLGFLLFYHTTKQAIKVTAPISARQTIPLKHTFTAFRKNRAALILISMIAGVTFGLSFIMATIIHYFEYALEMPQYAGYAQAGFIGIALIAIPLWSWANNYLGKKYTWVLGTFITCLGLFTLASMPSSPVLAVTAYTVTGFGSSLYGISIWTMIPDTVEFGEHRTGVRLESSIIGIVSAFQKLTIAAASFALGILMEWASPSVESALNLEKIALIVAIIPAATIILSAIMAQFYPAYETEHQKIAQQLTT
ncbi:MFS transporter [Kordiimonas sp. SCSIO 12603]|uniref:MFS transporter n=1 Tax=Kordiimonas sp. SCSIO 12603 TaxID=2829596 RepID=UPI0021034E71|nr:MFS transporter [Kordiimonas sp. SCSIO 12603]UTW58811.1 MFS transporter [Kordiimonas sp. SCSIO 12603]